MGFELVSGVHLMDTIPIIPTGFLEKIAGPSSFPGCLLVGRGLRAEAPRGMRGLLCRPAPFFSGGLKPRFWLCRILELKANCELGAQLCPAELAPCCLLFPTDMYINSWHLLNQI